MRHPAGRALSGPIAARSPVGRAVSGPVGAVLHIRSGPATGGSAESCGNIPELNAGEILPCAERVPLHMGEHRRKTSDSREPRNPAENPGSVCGGAALRCAIPRDQRCAADHLCGCCPGQAAPPRSAVHPDGSASRAPPAPAAAVRVRDVVRVGGRDGGRGPANREEWRSGRIVPPRTRRPPRRSRGIMRMPPGASGARRRTILPERQNRAGGGAGAAAIDSAGRLGATLPP